jgi:hypothetical protein
VDGVLVSREFGRLDRTDFLQRAGLVLAALTEKKAACTLRNNWPLFSMATMVFSKVGGAGLFAIASISLRSSAMPASIAGW